MAEIRTQVSYKGGEENQDVLSAEGALQSSDCTVDHPLASAHRSDLQVPQLSIVSRRPLHNSQLDRLRNRTSMSVSGPPGAPGGRHPLRGRPARTEPRAPTPHPLVRRGLGSNLGGGVIPRGVSPGSAAATYGSNSLTPGRQASPVSTSTPAAPRSVSSGSVAAAIRSSSWSRPARLASPVSTPTPARPPAPVYILGTPPVLSSRAPSPPPDLTIGSSNHARELVRAQVDSRPHTQPTSGQERRLERV